jgi:N-acylglucosamine-6-phosphate 2-epimerase
VNRNIEKILPRGVVVSCQLDSSEPLHSPQHCALFAQAAALGGAVGIRAEGLENIKEIRATVRLPIIGCIRERYGDQSPLVTGSIDDVDRLLRSGCDVVAMDGTARLRPGSNVSGTRFVADVRKQYPDAVILADVSTFEEGVKAADVGANAVSMVLFGRTGETFETAASLESHLDLVYRLSTTLSQPVFAEGFIWNLADAEAALEAGAYGVIVGGAITRPRVLTRLFADSVNSRLV